MEPNEFIEKYEGDLLESKETFEKVTSILENLHERMVAMESVAKTEGFKVGDKVKTKQGSGEIIEAKGGMGFMVKLKGGDMDVFSANELKKEAVEPVEEEDEVKKEAESEEDEKEPKDEKKKESEEEPEEDDEKKKAEAVDNKDEDDKVVKKEEEDEKEEPVDEDKEDEKSKKNEPQKPQMEKQSFVGYEMAHDNTSDNFENTLKEYFNK